ncbi:MAG: DUF58 domain-containing protein [Chloroflexota bacterium]|nr:DUF58 domain-containing protein [Chloroflexota bacterium]
MLSQMLHELWMIVFVVLIGIGIFAGEGLLIGFSVMGLLVVGTARLWNRASLLHLTYEREFSQQRVFMGEKAILTITLTNRKPLPLGRVRVEDDMPACMTLEDADVVNSPNPEAHTLRHSTSMSWYERVRWTYEFRCDRRGYFRVGPSYLRSGDLLGFFGSERESQDRDYVLVYPRLVSLPEIGIPSARPLGETRGGIRIFEDMARPMGLRDYQTGDALKTVDWKASARMQELQVRTYEPSTSVTVVLAVAVDTMAHTWEGYSPTHLERIITAAASLSVYASERHYNLGLFSNGTPVLADRPMKVAPSQAPEQLTIILEALASIRPLPMGSITGQLAQQWRRFPLGATVVVVLSLMSDDLPQILESMQAHGYKLVVVYVGDDPCPPMPDGVILHEIGGAFEGLEFSDQRNFRQVTTLTATGD